MKKLLLGIFLGAVLLVGAFPAVGQHNLTPVEVKGKWGYRLESDSSLVIKARYDSALQFWYGQALVMKRQRWGMIDQRGKWLAKPRYDRIYNDFRNGVALVERKGLFGYIDTLGNLLVKPIYVSARPFVLNRAQVQDTEGFFFIDSAGVAITDLRFDEADLNFLNGLARVRKGKSWGAMDARGKWVLPLAYDQIKATKGTHFWLITKGDSTGYADPAGRVAMAEEPFLLPDLTDSMTIAGVQEAILRNRTCLVASTLTPEEALALAGESGAPARMTVMGPPKLGMTVHLDECAWLVTTEYSGTTREGDCQFTNGCTVRLIRKIWVDALNKTILERKESRAVYPNYE